VSRIRAKALRKPSFVWEYIYLSVGTQRYISVQAEKFKGSISVYPLEPQKWGLRELKRRYRNKHLYRRFTVGAGGRKNRTGRR
jgi:hypothetical protein